MTERTKAQQMMIDDGFPPELLLSAEERKAAWKGVKLTKVRDLKAPAKDEDPATKALRKEIAAAEARKKAASLARLKELRASTKKAAPAAATQENHMATKTAKKTTKKAPAKKAAPAARGKAPAAARKAVAPTAPAAGERADGLRAGSKQAIMLDMVLAEGGATEAELCKALDWKKCRVTLKRVCEKVGAKLDGEKVEGRGTVYKARLAKKAAA